MFTKHSPEGYLPAVDKITRKTLVYGDKTLMSEFRLEAGAILPQHRHPYEQTGYLVSGRMELTIGTSTYQVDPGDSWSIPENVMHAGTALEYCIALEVFAPVRDDYLP